LRIGIDARLVHYRRGGISRYVMGLLGGLAAADHQDQFVVLQSRLDPHALVEAPNFRRYDLWTPPHHAREQLLLPLELGLTGIDLLHSPDFIPPQRRRCRSVITVHDLGFLIFPDLVTDESRRYYSQLEDAVRSTDAIIAVSEQTRRDMAALLGVPPRRVDVIYHGVDPCFGPATDSDALKAFRRHHNLPERYFLFVGTIEPRKNLGFLLDAYRSAFERASSEGKPHLLLAGQRGWRCDDIFERLERPEYRSLVRHCDGFATDELVPLYQGALALVLPSLYEGFGFPALEAMACGTPVVCSAVSSLPEVVGEAALALPPDDAPAWMAALRQLAEDEALRADLRQRGIERARQFDWRRTADQTLAVYRRALQAR